MSGRNSQAKMTPRISARRPGKVEKRYRMAGIQPNMATGTRYIMSPIEPLLGGRQWADFPINRKQVFSWMRRLPRRRRDRSNVRGSIVQQMASSGVGRVGSGLTDHLFG